VFTEQGKVTVTMETYTPAVPGSNTGQVIGYAEIFIGIFHFFQRMPE
jgi:hypothetical protein